MIGTLVNYIVIFLRWFLGAGVPPPPENPCPICGEEWEPEANFCSFCGYEKNDETHPLHPRPERTGRIVDPDKILDQFKIIEIEKILDEMSVSRNMDIVIFILDSKCREFLKTIGPGQHAKTLESLAYALFNSWRMGQENSGRGLLLAINPESGGRAFVQGKNGPGITGSEFRNYYAAISSEITANENVSISLSEEIDLFAEKLDLRKSEAA